MMNIKMILLYLAIACGLLFAAAKYGESRVQANWDAAEALRKKQELEAVAIINTRNAAREAKARQETAKLAEKVTEYENYIKNIKPVACLSDSDVERLRSLIGE